MAEGSHTAGALEGKLEDLKALSGDIRSCAVLSGDVELKGTRLAEGVERERAAAMLAALANLSERTARENGKEHASQTRVKTEDGYVLMVRLDDGGTLAAITDPEARVGLVLYDMRNARDEVQRALEGEEG
jgi:predicted regulator of Ras-like GTPase activity (Roadblock/LC7/MglB family)